MAANGISTLATKEARQLAKLDLAQTKRLAQGNARSYYDLTQLPTQYDDNAVVDNANADGLIVGRPWISISYAINPSSSAVNEGDTITYTITTFGVVDGTTLYWTNSGTTTGADFTGDANSGSFTVNSGSATITRPLKNDFLTDGAETVILQIRTGSTSGPIVVTSGTVNVTDTSTPVVDQYGFFEQQLDGGTYMTFDQTIGSLSVKSICTNFNGNPIYGSYMKVNGVVVASDHTLAPDGQNNSLVGGSASLSGTGQYLSVATSNDFIMSGDFTVEGWFYPTSVTGNHMLFCIGGPSADRYNLQLTGTGLFTNKYGAGSTNHGGTISINTWVHIAMVRSGTTVKIYVNGTALGFNDIQAGTLGNGPVNIGADDSGSTVFAGRITNFRIVKGSAVYTANFTPSTIPLLPVTNTKLLLSQMTTDELLSDTGPSKRTLTNNGSVTWNSSSPFTAGSASSVSANGTGYYMQRGHTVVVINSDGTIASTVCYDTYGSPSLGTTIKSALLNLPENTIVAIGTYDATGLNQDFRDALTDYFDATTYSNTWSPSRISHMFLGRRNATPVIPALVSFTSVGSTTWTAPARTTSVTYLIAGAGGGAGNGYDNAGGGGGGGGMILSGTMSVTPGQTYTVTVGSGGAGGADARVNNAGTAGGNSVFATVTALGGGAGLGSRTGGTVGAAQIGSSTAPTGGAGTGGGTGGLGGGGASTAGSTNSGATGGNGGDGISSSITGSPVTYGAGGAGGGAGAPTTDGANGTANRGNGGQGGRSNSADSSKGGNGGSGIVILSYNE